MHRRVKTDAMVKPTHADVIALSSSLTAVKVGGGQDAPQLIISNAAAPAEEKVAATRGGEFPLDHILPVFNLNSKKESSFIPTLKVRQKETGLASKDKFAQN